ncbi:MAG: hypothetical protein JSV12_07635 [Candidatus Bathyarchaeota archaeon]|nr:MAG: hypothetical protein JSV12_07635 [Candidatus Bathyarchaeota archaeon]
MTAFEREQKRELKTILEKAADFHGHFGPFLVIGVRMGLIGIRRLEAKKYDGKLRVTAMLEHSVPFSCAIDGIQVTTKCTIGNKKLKLIDSSGIAAKFELQHKGQVTVMVNPVAFNRLKRRLLSENVPPEKMEKLARMVASMPEEELFIIE